MRELDVERMLRQLPARQFRLWEMYDEIDPFGDYRADIRAAQIASYIFNMAVQSKDRKDLTHFLLPFPNVKPQPGEKSDKPIVVMMPNGPVEWDHHPTAEENDMLFKMHQMMCVAAINAAGAFDPTKVKES